MLAGDVVYPDRSMVGYVKSRSISGIATVALPDVLAFDQHAPLQGCVQYPMHRPLPVPSILALVGVLARLASVT